MLVAYLVGVGGGKGRPVAFVACLIGVFGGKGKFPVVVAVLAMG